MKRSRSDDVEQQNTAQPLPHHHDPLRQIFQSIHNQQHQQHHESKRQRRSHFLPWDPSGVGSNESINQRHSMVIEQVLNIMKSADQNNNTTINTNDNRTVFINGGRRHTLGLNERFIKSMSLDSPAQCLSELNHYCSMHGDEMANEYAKATAILLMQFQPIKKSNEMKNGDDGGNDHENSDAHVREKVKVLCQVAEDLIRRHEFNRELFVRCLLQPGDYFSNYMYRVLDLRVLQMLDERQLITFESYIESFCLQDKLNAVLLVAHLTEYWSSNGRYLRAIEAVLNNFKSRRGGSDTWKKANSLFSTALRQWKTNYFRNNQIVIEIYMKSLQLSITDMDVVLKEIGMLLSSEKSKLTDIFKFSSVPESYENWINLPEDSVNFAFRNMMHLLSVQQALNVIDSCIRSFSCDWGMVISLLLFICKSHGSDVTRYLTEVFEESMSNHFVDLATVVIIIARHVYSSNQKQSSYDAWLKNNVVRHFTTRKDSSTSGKVLKKNRQFLLSILTSMIPHDNVTALKQMVFMLETGLDCSDYITAVKDQLNNLGSSTDKFSVAHFVSSKPAPSGLVDVVKKALLDFEKNKMTKIPQNIANKQYLDRIWYIKQFLPTLIMFEETGPERNKYRILLREMIKLMVKRSMIDGSIMQEYESKIEQIQSFEPDLEDEEDEVIYLEKDAITIPDPLTNDLYNDKKRLEMLCDGFASECSISFGVDTWIESFRIINESIVTMNQEELTIVEKKYYVDTIFTFFMKCTDIIATKYESEAIETFCSLLCSSVLLPFTSLYTLLTNRLTTMINHVDTNSILTHSLGVLIGNMCQIKYYQPERDNLAMIADSVLDDLYPTNCIRFSEFSLSYLRYCFSKFSPVAADSLTVCYQAKLLIYVPVNFTLRTVWAMDRQATIEYGSTKKNITCQIFQKFAKSPGFVSFIRGKDMPLSMLVRCELFFPLELDTARLCSLFRDRLLSVYLGQCNMTISKLFVRLYEEAINCYVKHVQLNLGINYEAERVLISILQEFQPLITKDNQISLPLFEILHSKLGHCNENFFKMVERSSKLMMILDSRILFCDIISQERISTRLSLLRDTIRSFSHVYPWPYEFTTLLIRGLVDACIVDSENQELKEQLSLFLHSVPLLRVALLKLWSNIERTYIQAIFSRTKHSHPVVAEQIERLIIAPISDMNRSLELIFKNYRQVTSNSVVALCKSEPTVAAISLIEYSLCLLCFGSSMNHSTHYSVSQSSFSLRQTNYNLSTIQASFSKVLSHLSLELGKPQRDKSILSFFVTGMSVLVHSLIHQIVLRLVEHHIVMAQFSEYGLKPLEELKTLSAKYLIMMPESIFIFIYLLESLQLYPVTSENPLDCSITNDQLPFSSLLRFDSTNDRMIIQAAITSTFFVLLTKMSNQWMDKIASSPSFIQLFHTMSQMLDACLNNDHDTLSTQQPNANITIVLTLHKKKLKEFMATQSLSVRASLLVEQPALFK